MFSNCLNVDNLQLSVPPPGKHLEAAHPDNSSLFLPGPNEEFGIRLANRPFLVLRGRYGYVGTSSEHDLMKCNMDQPDCIHLLPCRQGIYHFQGEELLFSVNFSWVHGLVLP